MPATNQNRVYLVQSVERACDVLAAFRKSEAVLHLPDIIRRTGQTKATAFRVLSTLVSRQVLERAGQSGYRARFEPLHVNRYRIGYAMQSDVKTFLSTVNDGIMSAAREANIELFVLNNKASRVTALRNANEFVEQKVDLVIEFQLHMAIAETLSAKYSQAGIPVITIDAPQPGATFFGADNYKAGHMGGSFLGRWAATNWQGRVDQVLCIAPRSGFLQARLVGLLDGLQAVLPLHGRVQVMKYERRPSFEISRATVRQQLRHNNPARRVLAAAVNDQSALGILQGFRDFGREDLCAVVGQGAALEARQEMRKRGSRFIGSVGYFPETYGKKIIGLALDILEKQTVPKIELIQHKIIHAQNVDSFYPADSSLTQENQPDNFRRSF